MAEQRLWITAPFIVVAVMGYAVHTYQERQAYKTGIYIGNAAFKSQDFQNQQCGRLGGDASQRGCRVSDVNQDSVMEDALASANIIPALADSIPLHTGFRDGWREARSSRTSIRTGEPFDR